MTDRCHKFLTAMRHLLQDAAAFISDFCWLVWLGGESVWHFLRRSARRRDLY
jgi:hypothetical protein